MDIRETSGMDMSMALTLTLKPGCSLCPSRTENAEQHRVRKVPEVSLGSAKRVSRWPYTIAPALTEHHQMPQ